jgi:hypothetical protein
MPNGTLPMEHHLLSALTRNPGALARDFAGATAIILMLVVGLSLPGLV